MTKTNEILSTIKSSETFISGGENYAFHPPIKSKNHSRRWKYALPDLIKECFICDNQLKVKYNLPHQKYSQKNNWGYWTSKETDQPKYICNSCLKRTLLGKFKSWGIGTEKSRIFHAYLFQNKFGKKIKKV